MPKKFIDLVINFPRQALHAKKLGLVHPATNKKMSWDIKLPDDFSDLLNIMRDAPLKDKQLDTFAYITDDYEDTLDDESFEDFDLDDN